MVLGHERGEKTLEEKSFIGASAADPSPKFGGGGRFLSCINRKKTLWRQRKSKVSIGCRLIAPVTINYRKISSKSINTYFFHFPCIEFQTIATLMLHFFSRFCPSRIIRDDREENESDY